MKIAVLRKQNEQPILDNYTQSANVRSGQDTLRDSFCASRGTRVIELLAVYSSQIICSNLANLLTHLSLPPPPPPHCGELYTLVFRHIPSKRKSNLTERSEMRIQIMLLPAQSRFFRMLIPLSMFLLDSDKGKVKYSPLYGRGSKVTILVGRHFQSGMLPFERA